MTEILRVVDGRVEWRRVGDEVVALDLVEQRYLAVNRAGAILWPMLARGTAGDEMATALVAAYDLSPDVAGHDVGAFVSDLERRGIVLRTDVA